MEVSPIVTNRERHDREPWECPVAEDPDRRLGGPGGHRALNEVLLVATDRLDTDRLLQVEHEPGPDRLDDRGRAALFAVLRVGQIDMLEWVDVGNGAAARGGRHAI